MPSGLGHRFARVAEAEATFGRPIFTLCAELAAEGESRTAAGRILGFPDGSDFAQRVLPAIDPEGRIEWPTKGHSNSARAVQHSPERIRRVAEAGRRTIAAARAKRQRFIDVGGESAPLAVWARRYGLAKETIRKRIDQWGWSPEAAVITSPQWQRG